MIKKEKTRIYIRAFYHHHHNSLYVPTIRSWLHEYYCHSGRFKGIYFVELHILKSILIVSNQVLQPFCPNYVGLATWILSSYFRRFNGIYSVKLHILKLFITVSNQISFALSLVLIINLWISSVFYTTACGFLYMWPTYLKWCTLILSSIYLIFYFLSNLFLFYHTSS